MPGSRAWCRRWLKLLSRVARRYPSHMAVARQSQPDQSLNTEVVHLAETPPFYHGSCAVASPQRSVQSTCGLPLVPGFHAVDGLGSRKGTRAHLGGVSLDRRLDHRTKIAVAAHELRRPRRQAQHVLEDQHLTVAGSTGSDTDGRNGNHLRDLTRERLGDGFDHDREGAGLRDRTGVILDRLPAAFLAPLGAERAERVDRLRWQTDMAPQ